MSTPDSTGGHARYTHELLEGMATQLRPGEELVWLGSAAFVPGGVAYGYTLVDQLPRPGPPRGEFASPMHWARARMNYGRALHTSTIEFGGELAPSVFHLQSLLPTTATRMLRALRGQGHRIVATVHNVVPHTVPRGIPRRMYTRPYLNALGLCDALIVHSDNLVSELRDRLPVDTSPRIVVIEHGEWDVGTARVEEPAGRRRRRHLLFFGKIRPVKGLELILDAMRELPDYELTVAGEFNDRRYARHVTRKARGMPNVRLLPGYVPDDHLEALFTRASAVVLPYRQFLADSGVLHLAIAYGVPVVAANVGGLGASVARSGAGVVVEPGSVEALSNGITDLHEPTRYEQVTKSLRAAHRQRKGWTVAARKTLELYRSLHPTDGAWNP